MSSAVTARLNSTDEMLYSAERHLGSSRIIQVLWRFTTEVSPAALGNEWDRLNRSRLSRRAVSTGIPGARRTWVGAHNDEPLREYAETLTDDTAADWIDEQVRAPLPVDSTALWRLAAARYGRGSLVSLTVPHFRSDGLGVFAALSLREHRPVHRGFSRVSLTGSDLVDGLRQTTRAVAGSVGWMARVTVNRQERTRVMSALRAASAPSAVASRPRFFVATIVDLDAASWEQTAQAHGGTVNSLFIEIAANLVRARVPLADRASIHVGIPMNLRRSEDDGRANALVVVPLEVPAGAPQHKDLRHTRQRTKTTLQGSGEHSVTLVPEPLWHLLPPRYANRLKAPGAQQTDVVASNFGIVPDAVAHFAGQRADSVALRTMNVPGLVPEKARLRASLCMVQVDKRVTLTVTGMPDHFGDAKSLRQLVTDEFAAWGLRAERWWFG
jgi:diacylglycerol O-acyltransferase / wax synthase